MLDAGLRRLSQLDMPMATDAGGTQRDIEGSGMAGENVGGVSVLGFAFEDNGKIVPIRGHLDAIKSMMLGTTILAASSKR